MLRKIYLTVILVILVTTGLPAQSNNYYYQIPDTPSLYTAEAVAARMDDGLGFRYFWATSGLRDEDLQYKPSDSARTIIETLAYIYGLVEVLLHAVSKKNNHAGAPEQKPGFTELREQTLKNIQTASELLKRPGAKLEEFDMVFERPNGKTRYPFWNLINGPVADALWHIGQVVSFRRGSGNPFPEGVSVLLGKKFD